MTNKICIPVEIIRNSKLSPRARIIWAELSLLPKGVNGEFVGLSQKKYKIYIFKGVVDASIDSLGCEPQEKEELDERLH